MAYRTVFRDQLKYERNSLIQVKIGHFSSMRTTYKVAQPYRLASINEFYKLLGKN